MCCLSPSTTTFIPTSASLHPLWSFSLPLSRLPSLQFSFLVSLPRLAGVLVSHPDWICAVPMAPCSSSVKSTWTPLSLSLSGAPECRRQPPVLPANCGRSVTESAGFIRAGWLRRSTSTIPPPLVEYCRVAAPCVSLYSPRMLFHPSLVHPFHTRAYTRNI